MKLKFNLSNKELIDFYCFSAWEAPWHKKIRNSRKVMFPIAFLLVAAALFMSQQWITGIFVMIVAVLWFFFIEKYTITRLRQNGKIYFNQPFNEKLWAVREYEFKEEYFTTKTEYAEGKFQWKSVMDVMEREDAFWLLDSLTTAHIIPKRALSDEETETLKSLLAQCVRV